MIFIFAVLIGLSHGCLITSLIKLIDEDYVISSIFGLLSAVFGVLIILVAREGFKMEKIKITVEQEKALEKYKNAVKEKNWLSGYVNYRDSWVDTPLSCLEELSFNDFSLILNGWYEVEQPFEVGDWVYDFGVEAYRQIIEGSSFELRVAPLQYALREPKEFEKVTEPWKIMLLELGRENPEFKLGDICTTNNEYNHTNRYSPDDKHFEGLFKEGSVKYFYPVESRIELNKYNK